MTNYEKYKHEFIKMLACGVGTCSKIKQIRTGTEKKNCSLDNNAMHCMKCERINEQWLNEEADEDFNPAELNAGDRIIMRKHENTEFSEFEVVCNRFPACWLRLRVSENEKSFLASEYGASCAKDEGFLIFYDDLLDKYEVKEVFR